jgi:putrescine aminotransferase
MTRANRSKQHWQALDRAHHLHPFTDFHELGAQGTRVITRAEHIYIYDIEGREYLDAMSGLWCCNLGYSRREIVDAITQQLQELPFYNNFFQCAHPPSIELAQVLAAVAPPHMKHVFFTNSGSEGNDTVVRMVRRYWDLEEQPQKRWIISRVNAYHGSTIAGASLGGMSFVHKQFEPLPYVTHIQQPYWYGEGAGLSPEEFGVQAARALEARIEELGPDNVAAFIAEPVQGAGGVIIAPESYWPEVRRVLAKYDILLVMDEVICGFGRTGKWFGNVHYGMKPDLMTFAKAVTNGYQPLGGVMVGERVAEVLTRRGGEFGHGFTYSGHPGRLRRRARDAEDPARGKRHRERRGRVRPASCQALGGARRSPAGWRGAHAGALRRARTGEEQEHARALRARRSRRRGVPPGQPEQRAGDARHR